MIFLKTLFYALPPILNHKFRHSFKINELKRSFCWFCKVWPLNLSANFINQVMQLAYGDVRMCNKFELGASAQTLLARFLLYSKCKRFAVCRLYTNSQRSVREKERETRWIAAFGLHASHFKTHFLIRHRKHRLTFLLKTKFQCNLHYSLLCALFITSTFEIIQFTQSFHHVNGIGSSFVDLSAHLSFAWRKWRSEFKRRKIFFNQWKGLSMK